MTVLMRPVRGWCACGFHAQSNEIDREHPDNELVQRLVPRKPLTVLPPTLDSDSEPPPSDVGNDPPDRGLGGFFPGSEGRTRPTYRCAVRVV